MIELKGRVTTLRVKSVIRIRDEEKIYQRFCPLRQLHRSSQANLSFELWAARHFAHSQNKTHSHPGAEFWRITITNPALASTPMPPNEAPYWYSRNQTSGLPQNSGLAFHPSTAPLKTHHRSWFHGTISKSRLPLLPFTDTSTKAETSLCSLWSQCRWTLSHNLCRNSTAHLYASGFWLSLPIQSTKKTRTQQTNWLHPPPRKNSADLETDARWLQERDKTLCLTTQIKLVAE